MWDLWMELGKKRRPHSVLSLSLVRTANKREINVPIGTYMEKECAHGQMPLFCQSSIKSSARMAGERMRLECAPSRGAE